jgi:hypothetical protein
LWTDRLGLHQVIESSLDPLTAIHRTESRCRRAPRRADCGTESE